MGFGFGGFLLPSVRIISRALPLVCVALALTASAALAQSSPVTPDMAPPKLDLDTFLAQSHLLHSTTPQASTGNGNPIVAAPDASKPLSAGDMAAIDQLLTLSGHAPTLDAPGAARGLALGQGRLPTVPVMVDLDHATAQAMVAAFTRPSGITAEDQAQIAAAASVDPVMDEKIGLVRTLYRVDGTDALLRHFVATEHMRLIITEVNNHIAIDKLSEGDRYRLSAIAASAETELEDKILTMDARVQATNLSKPELLQLIAAYDSDAQRKQTQQRLSDSGKLDRAIDLDIKLAQIQIVKASENDQ